MHLKGSKHKKGKITQSLFTSAFLFNHDGTKEMGLEIHL